MKLLRNLLIVLFSPLMLFGYLLGAVREFCIDFVDVLREPL